MDRAAWWAPVHGVARVEQNLATKPPSNRDLLYSTGNYIKYLIKKKKKTVLVPPLPGSPPAVEKLGRVPLLCTLPASRSPGLLLKWSDPHCTLNVRQEITSLSDPEGIT